MIDYTAELNWSQKEAAQTTEGALQIVAGAGSGKTRTLVYRVAYMIEHGIAPEHILLLTFTNKAAQEMQSRAAHMLDDRCSRITACTFHSFCNLMLRKYGPHCGIPGDFQIMASTDVNDAINLLRTEREYNKLRGFPKPGAVAGMISTSVNVEVSLDSVIERSKYSQFKEEIKILGQAFAAYKREKNLMDYDDLLVVFLRMITENEAIRDKIANTYQYIMVDEYQDTNNIQEKIILKLREKVANIAIVGDDYQSIYSFRGGNVRNIIEFPLKFDHTKSIVLNKNYRSTQQILDLANRVMKVNATEGIYKEMRSDLSGEVPEIVLVNNLFDERDYVIQDIEDELRQGRKPSEIAVLIRKNMQSSFIEAALTQKMIPFVKYGGTKFLDRPATRDVLAYLRALTNPHDELAWFRILSLYQGIGHSYAEKLSKLCSSMNESFLLYNPYGRNKFYGELLKIHEQYQKWKDVPFSNVVEDIRMYYYNLVKENTLSAKLKDEGTRTDMLEKNEKDAEDLKILVEMSKEYHDAVAFLDALTLDATATQDDTGSVVISTIHSAKGLEFEVVYILDCVQGTCPATTELDAGSSEDNEELRCFYVAMTRAKEKLRMIVPKSMNIRGRYEYMEPSHYLTNDDIRNYCNVSAYCSF